MSVCKEVLDELQAKASLDKEVASLLERRDANIAEQMQQIVSQLQQQFKVLDVSAVIHEY